MSQSRARASRRQIRRAFGDDAFATLESYEDALKAHQQLLARMGSDLLALMARCDNLETRLAALEPGEHQIEVRQFATTTGE